MACGTPAKELKTRKLWALFSVCLGLFGCLYFIIALSIGYRQESKIMKSQHRSYSATASDYTLEIGIPKKLDAYFENCEQNGPGDESRESYGQEFQKLLIRELMVQLEQQWDLRHQKSDGAADSSSGDI